MAAVEVVFLGAPIGGFSAYPRKQVDLYRAYDKIHNSKADFFEMKAVGMYVLYVYGVNEMVTGFEDDSRGGSNFCIALQMEGQLFTDIKYVFDCLKSTYQEIKEEGKILKEKNQLLGFVISDMQNGQVTFESYRRKILKNISSQQQLFQPFNSARGGKPTQLSPKESNEKLLETFWQTGRIILFNNLPVKVPPKLVTEEKEKVVISKVKPSKIRKELSAEEIYLLDESASTLATITRKIGVLTEKQTNQALSDKERIEVKDTLKSIQQELASIKNKLQPLAQHAPQLCQDQMDLELEIQTLQARLKQSSQQPDTEESEFNTLPFYKRYRLKELLFLLLFLGVLLGVAKPGGEWYKEYRKELALAAVEKEKQAALVAAKKVEEKKKAEKAKQAALAAAEKAEEERKAKEARQAALAAAEKAKNKKKQSQKTTPRKRDAAGYFRGTSYYLDTEAFLTYATKNSIKVTDLAGFGKVLLAFLKEKSTIIKERCPEMEEGYLWKIFLENNNVSKGAIEKKIKRDVERNSYSLIERRDKWKDYIDSGPGLLLLTKAQKCLES